jgi:2-polyprenyl-3-methyl-5-hydroxy-6-metoxy-1,4-benzoquinol methylase
MTDVTPEQQTDVLWDYLKGFHAVHLIDIGTKLSLFAAIEAAGEGGVTAPKLAADGGFHPPYVDVWCRTAYAYGILDGDEGDTPTFRLAPHFDTLLVDSRHPRYLAPYFKSATSFYADDFNRYPDFFRDGGVYTYQEHGQEFSDAIATTTSGFHAIIARRMLPGIPGLGDKLKAGASVLDMGCGAAGLLMRIAEAHPAARCVGVDVDRHGINLADARIAEAGLADRVSAELIDGGEITHADEFDVVTLFEVLHEIPLAVRPQVIANAYKALKPGAPLFILDETYPRDLAGLRDREYALAVQTAFNELIWGNVVPTADDQDQLLRDAGFSRIERMQIATYFTAITAWKE